MSAKLGIIFETGKFLMGKMCFICYFSLIHCQKLKGNYRASPDIDLAVVGKAFPFQSAEFKSLATGNSKQFFFCNNNSLILKFLINNNLTFIIGVGNFNYLLTNVA